MTKEVQDYEDPRAASLDGRGSYGSSRRLDKPSTPSEVCQHHSLAAGQFYAWEKQARQGALKALRNGKRGRRRADPEAALRTEIERLRAVVAELSAENLELRGRWP